MAKRGREINKEQRTSLRSQNDLLSNIVNSAVSEGVDAMSRHSRYEPEFLAKYLDEKAVSEYASQLPKLIQDCQAKGKTPEEAKEYAQKSLASLISSGKLFNERGQRLILRKGLDKKLTGTRSKEVLEGEKYLDKALIGFRDLYELMKTGDYAQRLPELAQAVGAIYQIGALDSAINSLYENDLMNDKRYIAIKKSIEKGLRKNIQGIETVIQGYVPKPIVASIMAIIGIAVLSLMFFSTNITGNVINANSAPMVIKIPAMIFGAASFVLGVYLFLKK